MSDLNPQERARLLVAQYVNNRSDKDLITDLNDTYIVWFCYILGGWKALVSTTLMDDLYYEVTYDKEKKKTYLDVYSKILNLEIPDAQG